jgi:hypothetical protein
MHYSKMYFPQQYNMYRQISLFYLFLIWIELGIQCFQKLKFKTIQIFIDNVQGSSYLCSV